MLNVLVVGGAGFIGSHMVKMLGRQACRVTALDDLSSGHRDAVLCGDFVQGDMADRALLDSVLSRGFDAVMHFASFIQVGESVQHPALYYQNNVVKTLALLDAMRAHGVQRFIFSSTAATFGAPQYTPMDEQHPQHPVNPYGRTKLMVEQVLADYAQAYGLRSVSLRYFNAAGADPEGQLGERHEPETHLIPLVLQVAAGRRPHLQVFGRDYDTPDGTCVRDYVHVEDLCSAHWLALQSLMKEEAEGYQAYNLGSGHGFSVHEVIDTAQKVSGRSVAIIDSPRRAGDPSRLVADPTLARQKLGWQPQFSELRTLIEHAWRWETRQA
ncbi:MAG: UDP-glucose 4-epimerase GalE [Hydrogenophaga sp.]|nr:UDP-glucose 4-epimerase GalE [Hydrogenophaga sp.]